MPGLTSSISHRLPLPLLLFAAAQSQSQLTLTLTLLPLRERNARVAYSNSQMAAFFLPLSRIAGRLKSPSAATCSLQQFKYYTYSGLNVRIKYI